MTWLTNQFTDISTVINQQPATGQHQQHCRWARTCLCSGDARKRSRLWANISSHVPIVAITSCVCLLVLVFCFWLACSLIFTWAVNCFHCFIIVLYYIVLYCFVFDYYFSTALCLSPYVFVLKSSCRLNLLYSKSCFAKSGFCHILLFGVSHLNLIVFFALFHSFILIVESR